ncbi:MAG: Mur ligase family protein, partial [Candidatus Gracilibacteria bacterium]
MKNFIKYLRKAIPETNFLRLLYHKIMAVIAAVYYRFPSEALTVIAVTGTKGKTTTTNLITNILSFAGEKVGMTSTANFQIGDKKWINDLKQTTLSPFKLQGLLRQMVNEGCKYAVLETSSHAFTQSRIWGINIDVGVFTNITPEHIEYHGNFNNYLNAKGGIFKQVTRGKRKFGVEKTLIMNADDPYFTYFNQFVSDRKVSFGLRNGNVTAKEIQRLADCSHFVLQVPNNSISVKLNLPGDFNILNSLAADSVCIGLNISVEKIKEGLEKSSTIQGRFEHVNKGQGY